MLSSSSKDIAPLSLNFVPEKYTNDLFILLFFNFFFTKVKLLMEFFFNFIILLKSEKINILL